MATVALAKPATLGTAVLQIIQNSAVTATLSIKLQACDIDYRQGVEDTTGSNDGYTTAEGNALLGGQVAFQGLLVSTIAINTEGGTDLIGIQNVFSTAEARSRMRWSVGLANGLYLRGSMIVESCRVRWVRSAATVQLTIAGRITDTDPGTTEATGHYT